VPPVLTFTTLLSIPLLFCEIRNDCKSSTPLPLTVVLPLPAYAFSNSATLFRSAVPLVTVSAPFCVMA
jgi:hypothetical protein